MASQPTRPRLEDVSVLIEMETAGEEVVVACFKVLCRGLPI
jgi:hypothetical protein